MKIKLNLLVIVIALIAITGSCKKERCEDPIPSAGNTVTDIDGNVYSTVKIGNQVWMAENLRTTRYCNGDAIPEIQDFNQWITLNSGAWVLYGNNVNYNYPYGKLYNWYAATDSRNVCPCGWRVPSESDWNVLIAFADPSYIVNPPDGNQSLIAGGKLKSTGTQYWQSPNLSATNQYGFSAVPGGWRPTSDGMTYTELGYTATYWSASEFNAGLGWLRMLSNANGIIHAGFSDKIQGCSIRCIKN